MTTGANMLPCTNNSTAFASVETCRPLAMSLKVWENSGSAAVPGEAAYGQLNVDLDIGGNGRIIPYAINQEQASNVGVITTITTAGASSATVFSLDTLARCNALGNIPAVTWKPASEDDTEFHGSFGEGPADKIILPPAYIAGANVTSAGYGPRGGALVITIIGGPASAQLFIQGIYQYEYQSGSMPANLNDSFGKQVPGIADMYPSKESFLRKLMNSKPAKIIKHVAKDALKSIMPAGIGELIFEGVSSLLGSTRGVPRKIYSQNGKFYINDLYGTHRLNSDDVKKFYLERATIELQKTRTVDTILANKYKPTTIIDDCNEYKIDIDIKTPKSPITPEVTPEDIEQWVSLTAARGIGVPPSLVEKKIYSKLSKAVSDSKSGQSGK